MKNSKTKYVSPNGHVWCQPPGRGNIGFFGSPGEEAWARSLIAYCDEEDNGQVCSICGAIHDDVLKTGVGTHRWDYGRGWTTI